MMNHPNIARVHEAGSTEDGKPYYAMEHIQGVPITEYCDQHKLGIGERLRLFVQVCQGVAHAHHRGVIDRDLKPSNILVTAPDGRPVAKIIDRRYKTAAHFGDDVERYAKQEPVEARPPGVAANAMIGWFERHEHAERLLQSSSRNSSDVSPAELMSLRRVPGARDVDPCTGTLSRKRWPGFFMM